MVDIERIKIDARDEAIAQTAFKACFKKLKEKINEIEKNCEIIDVQISEIMNPDTRFFSGYIAFVTFRRENEKKDE